MKEQTRSPIQLYLTLPILAWALFDFANTIFSANIVTLFFPQYITEVVGSTPRLEQIASTVIAYANAVSAGLLILFSPLYGVTMDRTGARKKFVMLFTLLCVTATILMGVFGGMDTDRWFGLPNGLVLTIILFVFARFAYNSGNVFYDGMLSSLGNKKEIPLISGFGVALGYLGTLFGILTVMLLVGDAGVHNTFWLSGILFLVFALPLFIINKDQKTRPKPKQPFLKGYKDIYHTFKMARAYPSIFFFMIAYFFVNDALATAIAMMQPYATTVVGFEPGAFLIIFMVATAFSIVGAIVFSFVNRAIGSKKTFLIIATVLGTAVAIAAIPLPMWTFWIAAVFFGIAMGSTWVVSRTMIIELSPEGTEGQFFGLFAFSAKMSAIVGPFIYGSITWMLADYGALASRAAITSLIVMIAIGIIFLMRVREDQTAGTEG
ncbi:MFS transporter [Salinicoccus albus]|uniref:MFS transporter n=1 Tax=Salinicoccus albus TaxID=418756 RepID=UPI000382B383|nr:MFS transporter [Salinicoccus albus]